MAIEVSTIKRIQSEPEYYYTVEDIHLDTGCDGLTISYYEDDDKRHQYMCVGKEEAIAIAKAILDILK